MAIFTFGREHEKRCEAEYVRRSSKAQLLLDVVDGVHDLIEGLITIQELKGCLMVALVDGDFPVFENTEKWVRKVSAEFPELLSIWVDLSGHKSARVRERVAMALDRMPPELAQRLIPTLSTDKSNVVKRAVSVAVERRALIASRPTSAAALADPG